MKSPSVFNIDDQSTIDDKGVNDLNKKPERNDAHQKILDCAAEYCKKYPTLEKNMQWVKGLEQMLKGLDEECDQKEKEVPDENNDRSSSEKDTTPKQSSEEPIDVARLLKGIKLVYDSPNTIYTDTIQKQASFEKAKPRLASIMSRLEEFTRGVGGAPSKEEYESIKQELFAALGYITK